VVGALEQATESVSVTRVVELKMIAFAFTFDLPARKS
jgi:hypothetical protein